MAGKPIGEMTAEEIVAMIPGGKDRLRVIVLECALREIRELTSDRKVVRICDRALDGWERKAEERLRSLKPLPADWRPEGE